MNDSLTLHFGSQLLSQEKTEIGEFILNFLKFLKNNLNEENPKRLNKFSTDYFNVKYDYIITIDNFLKLGPRNDHESYTDYLNHTLKHNHEARQEYYYSDFQIKALNTVREIYVNFFFKLSKKIIIDNYEEFKKFNPVEKYIVLYSLDLNSFKPDNYSLKILNNSVIEKNFKPKLYNVIPLPLIKCFCAKLFNNLEFMKKYDTPSNFKTQLPKLIEKYNFFEQSVQKFITSRIDGNIFYGPSNRRPLLPLFSEECVGLYAAFEINSVCVLGQDKYEALFCNFLQIVDYLSLKPNENEVIKGNKQEEEKLLSVLTGGIKLYELLTETFNCFKALPVFDKNCWDLCELTAEEIKNLDEKEFNKYEDKRFWDFRKIDIFP